MTAAPTSKRKQYSIVKCTNSRRLLNLEEEEMIGVLMKPRLREQATLVSNIVFPKEDRILVQVVLIPKNGHDTISKCSSSK
jgi:hypothetical protein